MNLVMQPGASGNAAVTVLLDGEPVGEARGADVGTDGVARFDRSGMLRLVAGSSRRRHVLTFLTSDPGVRAFAFTFGPQSALVLSSTPLLKRGVSGDDPVNVNVLLVVRVLNTCLYLGFRADLADREEVEIR